MLESIISYLNTYLFGPGLCLAVFVCGVYFIIRLRPFFITKPKKILSALSSGGTEESSPFRAMIVALAGTLGVGNIAGVASAIAIGGAGAVFWMLVSAVAALPIKYAEIVLAAAHRRRDKDGKFHGGAYFYISDNGTKAAGFIASLFAALCVASSLTMGAAVQANSIAVTVESALGVIPLICGMLVGGLTFAVTSGGLSRISSLAVKLIPLMSGIYIAMSSYIILSNASILPEITSKILTEAFSAEALGGGILGFITSKAVRIGVTRGIVSNEAGCGTAPIAHSSAKIKMPAIQGVWGMFEVFIDTIVICTITAYVILIAKHRGILPISDGMASASNAFAAYLPCSDIMLCIVISVFAFCTIICWFYYGTESLSYLTKSNAARIIYTFIYSFFAMIGCIAHSELIWSLSDLTISAMTALNIAALLLSSSEIKRETDRYFY